MSAASSIPYGYDRWTMFLIENGPVLIVLPIGLWICFQNRYRRPRIARLIGAAILIELLLVSIRSCGPQAVWSFLMHLRQLKAFPNPEDMSKWSQFADLWFRIISNVLYAVIWAIAFSAALKVDESASEKTA